ncbi:helix-hairpin-helix domain-containing protein [Bacillus taeanensis]|uniref:Competence protein ComE n=1 Tax=Bacillus taeanensis TaxID=273032 RepID=A0A366Y246_9BACI|nr:helix-hairpin-helix domain-containing protein [Bacillus taeanensis]RBW70483.1 competence protein ComE [Bacillus taeanensis]
MQWTKRELGLGIGLIIVILLFCWNLFFSSEKQEEVMVFPDEEVEEVAMEASQSGETVETIIMVDIKGAVSSPGVYEMKEGQRIKDVIAKAEGLLSNADERQINLAMLVYDEMVIYIPTNDELISEETAFIPNSTEGGKVSINRADSQELETLPGIGPSKAEAILAYREENGPFKKIEELLYVSGIGEKSFEQLKDKIKIN